MNKILKIFALTVCVLSGYMAYAQSSMTVSGKVTDLDGQPIIGAAVMVTGQKSTGTVTDLDGNYTIKVPASAGEKASITVSCLSYETQKQTIAGKAVMDFILKDDAEHLDEVVVVGYGAMRRSDLTGSVASVKIDDGDAGRATSLDELLKGKAAGVSVISNSAGPDAAVSIRVRGATSLNGSNEPLYVVDGVIMSSPENVEMFSKGMSAGSDEAVNAMMGINPQDIASMEVLKDASATAIFGAAGANGVVLITTKSANRDRPTINFSAGLDIAQKYKEIEMLDFEEWKEYVVAQGNNYDHIYKKYPSDYHDEALAGEFRLDENGERILNIKPVNWQDYLMRTSISQRYYLSIAGRPNTLNYSFSMGYNRKEGIVKQTGAEQYTMRLNATKQIFKNFSIGTKTNLAYISSSMTQGMSTTNLSDGSSMMRSMMITKPYMMASIAEEIDDLDENNNVGSTPARWLADFQSLRTEFRITPNFFLDWKITPWLEFKSSVGGDYRLMQRIKWKGHTLNTGFGSMASDSSQDTYRWNWDNTLNFNYKIKKHSINATLGMTTGRSKSAFDVIEGWSIPEHKSQHHGINASPNTRQKYSETAFSENSYFGRAMYNYDDRYLVTATYRIDGSSKFMGANRYATFPSAAIAWRFSEEPWLKNADWFSMGKIRFGWGQVGNSGVSAYQIYPSFGVVSYPDHTIGNEAEYVVGINPTNIANASLKWETTQQLNAGIDLGFFDGRIALTVDVYDKYTYDLLQKKAISGASGFTSTWVNDGSIRNRGLEISLDVTPIATADFEWNLAGQISFNRNTIVSLGASDGGGNIFLSPENEQKVNYFLGANIGTSNYMQSTANIFIEGMPMGLFYGYKTDGIVQEGETGPGLKAGDENRINPGGIKYCDLNGNGYIESGDRTILGDPNPDFIYGFSTSFRWKGLTLNATFDGSYGNDLVNANLPQEADVRKATYGSTQNNVRKEYFYNAWTPEKPNNKYPALNSFTLDEIRLFTDRWVEDASFLRVSSVSLTYDIPLPKNKFMRNMSVGVTGRNLYVFTTYSGWDPEVSSYGNNMQKVGIDIGSYPTARTYSFDLKFTF